MDTVVPLPEDVLAAILNRLPPRDLARSRRVCRPWRDLVDARRLLLRHVLPHSVNGFFLNYVDYPRPHFLARPSSAGPYIDGRLSFLPGVNRKWRWSSVRDHRNGLILYTHHYEDTELLVVNPATRHWAVLPPLVEVRTWAGYIVYEPAVSPNYKVFLIPPLPKGDAGTYDEHDDGRYAETDDEHEEGRYSETDDEHEEDPSAEMDDENEDDPYRETDDEHEEDPCAEMDDENEDDPYSENDDEHEDDLHRPMEWPPSPFVLQVFSSNTGHWEERSFVREGESAGFVADLRRERNPLRHLWRHAVHFEEALYVQCRGAYVMRLSLHEEKYQVIKTPIGIASCAEARTYLGVSKNQVCFGAIQDLQQLSVWILKESTGCTDWVLKHQVDVALSYHYDRINKEWTLEDESYSKHTNIDLLGDDQLQEEGGFSGSLFVSSDEEKDTKKAEVDEIIEWNSDDDNALSINDEDESYIRHISILGFHPYKEVIFLADSFAGIAYHLNTSKFQYLGSLRPKSYYTHFADVERSFLYTPSMIEELPRKQLWGLE